MGFKCFFISAILIASIGACLAVSPVVTKVKLSKLKISKADVYSGEMIYIPAGSFWMGNSGIGVDATVASAYPNEHPKHWVTLSGYSIGKYEVTRGEYRKFMNAGGYSKKAYWSSDGWNWKVSKNRTEPFYWATNQVWFGGAPFTQTDKHPVVGVTYYEAEAFCNWAGGHLPTEAQWERAARWDTATSHANVYPWGDTSNDEYCNNFYDSNPAGGGYHRNQTSPVGSYSSYGSPSGCQDMIGNVWEWCKDWYGFSYYYQSPASNPQGPPRGDYGDRIQRGGSWLDLSEPRCAERSFASPDDYYYNKGFRLAR